MTSMRRLQGLSDRELVEIARLGSLEAYNELVARFRGAVLVVASQSLRSREAAQDVAQETFLAAFHMLTQLHDPGKFSSWLYAIARNRARRAARREQQHEALNGAELDRLAEEMAPGPLDAVIRSETDRAIREVLADLPPDYRIVLQLFHCEQWPAVRIAEFLSLPLTTVKWRLRSGRERLRRRYLDSLEEKTDGRQRAEERDPPHGAPAAPDGGTRRACGADWELRERCAQLSEAL